MVMTTKRKVFVEEYLKCWNATEAARRAGYKHPQPQSSRLLSDVMIKELIKERLEEQKMTADEVLKRLKAQATTDASEFVDEEGCVDIAALKKAVKERGGPLTKRLIPKGDKFILELLDSQAALTLIGKHLGMFTNKIELTGEKGAPIKIEFVNDWRKTD